MEALVAMHSSSAEMHSSRVVPSLSEQEWRAGVRYVDIIIRTAPFKTAHKTAWTTIDPLYHAATPTGIHIARTNVFDFQSQTRELLSEEI